MLDGQDLKTESCDYLKIDETAKRSRLAVKTLYNRISMGRIGARQGVFHLGRKVVIHWPTFKAAVISSGQRPGVKSAPRKSGNRNPGRVKLT